AVGLVGATLLCLNRWLALGSPFPGTRLNLPILALLGMLALSFDVTPTPVLAAPIAAKVLAGALLFFVMYDTVGSISDLWRAAGSLALLGLCLALLTPFG